MLYWASCRKTKPLADISISNRENSSQGPGYAALVPDHAHRPWSEGLLIHFLLLGEARYCLSPFSQCVGGAPVLFWVLAVEQSAYCPRSSSLLGLWPCCTQNVCGGLVSGSKESSGDYAHSATSRLACKFSLYKPHVVTAPCCMWKAGSPNITSTACW